MGDQLIEQMNEEQQIINRIADECGLIPTWNDEELIWEYIGTDADRNKLHQALEENNLI